MCVVIRNTKRVIRVQHTRKYQLFIYALVTRGKLIPLSYQHAQHSFFSSSPSETIITPSLNIKNPRSEHPIDDSYLRRRDIMLNNQQWHLQQKKMDTNLQLLPSPPTCSLPISLGSISRLYAKCNSKSSMMRSQRRYTAACFI